MAIAAGQWDGSLSTRFVAKLMIDVLPAAAASLIGSFLISQYQFRHAVVASPPTEQTAPASVEMMQLVHDEHTAIMSYLKTEMAAQQHRHAVEDEAEARAIVESKAQPVSSIHTAASPVSATAPLSATASVSAPVAPLASARTVVIAAALPRQPLVLTPVNQNTAAASVDRPQQPKSLLAATLDVKDHVVDTTLHATWHAVSAIGSIPSWLASFGSHVGGSDADAGVARLSAS